MINKNLFVEKFLNNQLNCIQNEDQFLSGKDINLILDKIKKIQQDKFNIESTIEKMIIDTNIYLPNVSKSLIKIYFYNQQLIYQIFKQKYYKCNDKNINYFINEVFNYLEMISEHKHEWYEQSQICKWEEEGLRKDFWINKFYFWLLTLKNLKKIFLYLSSLSLRIKEKNKIAYKNRCLGYLAGLYKSYICTHVDYQEHKTFINVIVKLTIRDLNNQYYFCNIFNEEQLKQNYYLQILDIIISNWNLVYPRYQSIIKKNSKKWIKNLIDNNFQLSLNKDILLHIIDKL